MAYVILKDDEHEQGESYEKYYEFDADDRDTVSLVEELLTMRSQSTDEVKREIDDLLDDISAEKQKLTEKIKLPKWLRRMVKMVR